MPDKRWIKGHVKDPGPTGDAERAHFHALVERIQERNAALDQQAMMDAIDQAVAEVRAERS